MNCFRNYEICNESRKIQKEKDTSKNAQKY